MADPVVYYTADMVRAMADEVQTPRYETVYGELLVSPTARLWHQIVVDRLTTALRRYIEEQRLPFYAVGLPADISWRPDVLVNPDAFVTTLEQARTLDWRQVTDLRLVVEVLSPSNPRWDRFTKRRLYQEQRIPLYWIVEADAHYVEVWTPEALFPTIERETLTWCPVPSVAPMEVALRDLFRPL